MKEKIKNIARSCHDLPSHCKKIDQLHRHNLHLCNAFFLDMLSESDPSLRWQPKLLPGHSVNPLLDLLNDHSVLIKEALIAKLLHQELPSILADLQLGQLAVKDWLAQLAHPT